MWETWVKKEEEGLLKPKFKKPKWPDKCVPPIGGPPKSENSEKEPFGK